MFLSPKKLAGPKHIYCLIRSGVDMKLAATFFHMELFASTFMKFKFPNLYRLLRLLVSTT
jgi:hypothetical protein